jgi:hypothetical protein
VKIEIKTWNTKTVLWSGEAVDIAGGVQKAVAAGVSLAYASLAGANLTDARLTRANLMGAELTRANLTRASLVGVNLAQARLAYARLAGANLTGADLAGAVFDEPICRINFGRWAIYIRANETIIDGQSRANSEWLKWTPKSRAIRAMHADAPAWWAAHGAVIKEAIRCVMQKAEAAR